MATFTGNRLSGVSGTRPEGGDAAGTKTMIWEFDVPATAASGDELVTGLLPKRSTLFDVQVITQKLDAGGTPAITFNTGIVRNGVVETAYFSSAAPTARSGGTYRATNMSEPVRISGDTRVRIAIAGAPATGQAGKVWIVVSLLNDIS